MHILIYIINSVEFTTLTHILRRKLLQGMAMAAAILTTLSLTGCFTGVERTDKISLSREDRKLMRLTPEEKLLQDVAGQPLKEWVPGKPFIVVDNKAVMVFDREGTVPDTLSAHITGMQLSYKGSAVRRAFDGSEIALVTLTDGSRDYIINTAMPPRKALEEFMSTRIPMLVDGDMVVQTADSLKGRRVWSRSDIYYDESGHKITHDKFVAFTVLDVQPGDMVFPLKVKLRGDDGRTLYMRMNYGISSKESRSFPRMFSLSDIRERYPAITDEVWRLICAGKVQSGMTKDECKLSLGNPSEVSSGHDYSQTVDIWHYPDGIYLLFEDGRLTRMRY